MTFFPMLLSGNENSEQKLNPMLQTLDLHLSRSPILVTFKDPNKQLPNVRCI